MFEEFLIRAAIAGVALAVASGPIGCFILWKRLAYFGDTLGHSALLGVILSLTLNIHSVVGVFLIACAVSMSMIAMRNTQYFSSDTSLGILSHAALAIGLILISLSDSKGFHLSSLLFGDILAVSWLDVWISIASAITITVILLLQWRALLVQTINSDMAKVEKIGFNGHEIIFLVLCSGLVAIAMKIMGALLISALLILPAAIARIFSQSPLQMAVLSAIFGTLSVLSGLLLSFEFDFPSGPAIIISAVLLLIIALTTKRLSQLRN